MAVQAYKNMISRSELGGVAALAVIGVALVALAPTKQPVERASSAGRRVVPQTSNIFARQQ